MTAEKIMGPCQKQWSLLQELNCLSELQTKVWSFQFTGWWWLMMMTHDDDDEVHIREKVTYELEKTVTLYIWKDE